MAAEFHTLTVAAVEPITEESVSVTFSVPNDLSDRFRHIPGQHVIVRSELDGEDVRRSYSICSEAEGTSFTIGVKHLEGGIFSTYACTALRPGDTLEVTPPTGDFTIEPDGTRENHYVAIAAGSGITPILSMMRSVLPAEPHSSFTLIYGNRDGRSIMFLDELDALKGKYPDRVALFHVLSREAHMVPILEGRIDEAKLEAMFDTVVDADRVTGWYLCGPSGVIRSARAALAGRGVPDDRVHDELFYAGDDASRPAVVDDATGSIVRFTLDGRTSTVIVDPEGAPILDHALTARPDTPFSCRSGACASCRAVVTKGEVRMDRNWSLNAEEVAAGQVLTCQAHPMSDDVELSYDR